MKKYMKPAMKAVFVESQDMIAMSLNDAQGNGMHLSNRYEEDDILENLFEKEDFNPWKRNK